ncbi:MAG: ABC transporter permease [Epsilonproteobacteria bacterium]|nr:ABC transporter permease [Campylobacterota bacterium]
MKFLTNIFVEEPPFLFACPALMWQVLFLYLPLFVLMLHSFSFFDPTTYTITFTFQFYRQVLNWLYFSIIVRSFILACATSVVTLLVAYPVAYFLAMKIPKRFSPILLFSLLLPSWITIVVQIYAWFFFLGRNGQLSYFLYKIGIFSQPLHLLNNYFAVLVGMTSFFLPFMILPIYAVLEKMDKRLLEVSADLGANRMQTFWRVIFPLSLPGVYAGLFLVFIPAFGEFVVPAMLGGGKYLLWGNVIVDKFLRIRNWRAGSAVAAMGIACMILALIILYLLLRLIRLLNKKSSLAR